LLTVLFNYNDRRLVRLETKIDVVMQEQMRVKIELSSYKDIRQKE